ncbi:hypothetical protein JW960_06525 [candidate division KSB1 bacterium]|nr:hypothetical protein [candidate division KSB1 bacterium]
MPSTFPCPKCGEYHYHKSHSKGTLEQLRKKLLNARVYRCHMCGYRAWERKKSISKIFTPRMMLRYALACVIACVVGYLFQFIIQ